MILFSETQKFRQWWIWAIILIVIGFQVNLLYHEFEKGSPEIKKVLLLTFVHVLVVLIFLYSKLSTEITENEIMYKFFPFNWSKKSVLWVDVERAYVRTYNPILEYGGWGYRFGLFGKGKALNVSGNVGLQLELKNGKKILIGTKKQEELKLVIVNLEKKLRRSLVQNQN